MRLLMVLADKLQAKPTRANIIVSWLRACFLHHAAVLASSPDLIPTLTPLYQSINTRLATHQQLVTLQGKLDLLMAQVRGVK